MTPLKTAQAVINKLHTAIRNRDLESAVGLYEKEATLVVYPGMVGKGTQSISAFFEGLFSLETEMEYESKNFTETDDLVLFTAKWTILSPISRKFPVPRTNYQAIILRKQNDGSWLIVVDNPWGPEPPHTGRA